MTFRSRKCRSTSISSSQESRKKIVTRVQEGLLEGVSHTTKTGYTCNFFLGIPYASPPGRFEKPKPMTPWVGVRKCDELPNRSIFREMFWEKFLAKAPQSEDCLYLNVFAPELKAGSDAQKSYPVLFYIHCGGYMIDSTERYTPDTLCKRLISRDIIIVTFHYRLGYLGFLSTGDEICPGNFGLWDMLEALKWTHKNIASFGGDPENITISGHSAGAASADLLSYSPHASGIFKRKIIMGGNSHCHWAVQKSCAVREYCMRQARKLGWKEKPGGYATKRDESLALVEFFKKVPAGKIGTTMFFCKTIPAECRLPLAPVIDGDFFPTDIPSLRETQTHVPSIVGGGEYEALLFVAIYLLKGSQKEVQKVIEMLAKKMKTSRAQVLEGIGYVYEEQLQGWKEPGARLEVLRALEALPTKSRQKFYVDLISDIFGNYANHQFIQDQITRDIPCYAYSFDWQSKQLWGWLQHVVPFTGGTHTSDLTHLFDCNYMSAALDMNKMDKFVSKMTQQYFTNFIKTGDPNLGSLDSGQGLADARNLPEWLPMARSHGQVLSIKPAPEMKHTAYSTRMQKFEQFLGSRSSDTQAKNSCVIENDVLKNITTVIVE